MVLSLIAATVIVFVLLVITRPETFRVTRTATMEAPPAAVFDQVNDLYKWQAWSPWVKMDPNAKGTFEGPTAGKGAVFSWVSSNGKTGEGRMTILESKPAELVVFKLEFFKPFKATNEAEFTFKPEGNGTHVTWSMHGRNNFLAKAMSLFMDCDKMVGPSFEQGLADMKKIVEFRNAA